MKDDRPGQGRPRAPRNRQAEGPCAKLSLGLKREASAGGTQRCSCPSRWGVPQNGVQSEATRDPTEKREMPQGMSTCLERGCVVSGFLPYLEIRDRDTAEGFAHVEWGARYR